MNATLEAIQLAGIGLALVNSTAALVLARAGRRAILNKARRAAQVEADRQARWHHAAGSVRLGQLESDFRTVRHVLNDRGFMAGDRIIPARSEALALFQPTEETGT